MLKFKSMVQKISFETTVQREDEIFDELCAEDLEPVVNYHILSDKREMEFELASRVTFSFYYNLKDTNADFNKNKPDLDHILKIVQKYDHNISEFHIEEIDENELLRRWEKHLKPVMAGENLLIIPYAQNVNFDRKKKIPIYIDPGMAFGSGTHPTTRACINLLSQLKKYLAPKDPFLDCGCGSGVLTCVMGKLGFISLFAFDNDQNAIEASQVNFKYNQIENVDLRKADISRLLYKIKFTCLVANLALSVIVQHFQTILNLLKHGGYAILSGILTENLSKIVPLFEENPCKLLEKHHIDDWTTILIQKT
ncbi:50S ribosomal protein L11 methyltransferase [Candidatus Riflebacteria bacterium]